MNFSKLEFTWPLDKPLASWAPLFLASSHNSCAQCWKIMHQVSLSILTWILASKFYFWLKNSFQKMLKTRRISSGFQPYKFLENDLIFKIWLLRVNHTNLCKMRVVTWETKSLKFLRWGHHPIQNHERSELRKAAAKVLLGVFSWPKWSLIFFFTLGLFGHKR